MKDLNVFYIDINENDESGMDGISLVNKGAVEIDFLCFEEDKSKPVHLNFYQEDKHIITGVVARADYPIYRRNGDFEYYVVFTKDVIKKLIKKYSKQGLFNQVNLDHNDYAFVKNVYMVESYIVDKERGICPIEFKDIEDGSWICSFSVEDDELWNAIKNNRTFNAFSLQGLFHLEDTPNEQKDDSFDSWVKQYLIE
jgi:hypothetical protein